jgi:hypothetical protein
MLQTVIETEAFIAAADDAGMTEAERFMAISVLAADPACGDLIKGTGGCRKVRIAGRGKGKSGGYRLITFYADRGSPVFLLTVFSKGERADLNEKERNGLYALSKRLIASLAAQAVVRKGR